MAAALPLDPLLLQGDAGVAAAVKKLLHLRAAFEQPLLDVFGFPLILRHQLSAADCCSCCASCCCCIRAAPLHTYEHSISSEESAAAAAAAAECGAVANGVLPHTSDIPSSEAAAVAAADSNAYNSFASTSACSAGAAICSGTPGAQCYVSLPCSGSRCSCCRGHGGATAADSTGRSTTQSQIVPTSQNSTHDTSSSGEDTSRSFTCDGGHESATTLSVRRNKKRLRLIGENPVDAVVAATVSRDRTRRYARTQDERAVEILVSRNVLRQMKLPIDAGSYVLFFTADWLDCMQRSILAAQKQALQLLKLHDCCGLPCGCAYTSGEHVWSTGSSSGNTSCDTGDSAHSYGGSSSSSTSRTGSCGDSCAHEAHTLVGRCEDGAAPAPDCMTCSGRCVADSLANTVAPLRFTPVLRQDAVQTDSQCEHCSHANAASTSRKRALLHLPARVGAQLRGVLQSQLLDAHTETCIDKRVLQEVLRTYLRAWHQRRRDAASYLDEVIRRAEDLLLKVNKEKELLGHGENIAQSRAATVAAPAASSGVHTEGKARTTLSGVIHGGGDSLEKHSSQCRTQHIERVETEHEGTDAYGGSREETRPHYRGDTQDVPQEVPHRNTISNIGVPQGPRAREGGYPSKKEAEDDAKLPLKSEGQSCRFDANWSCGISKRLAKVTELLQCGYDAAAEVLSLQESAEACAVLGRENTTFDGWVTEEGKEAKVRGRAEAQVEGSARQKEPKDEERRGTEGAGIKKEQDVKGGPSGQDNKVKSEPDTDKGLTAKEDQGAKGGSKGEDKKLKSELDADTKTEGGPELGGPRPGVATPAQLSNPVMSALYLREKVREATAILQVLTRKRKETVWTQLVQPVEPPSAVRLENLSPSYRSPTTSSAVNCETIITGPAAFRATEWSSTTGAIASKTPVKSRREAARVLKQRPAAESDNGDARSNGRCGGGQNQETLEYLVEREADAILLLLYDVPLLHSRAGSNAVALAVPQQGLLVRWLQDGRKEVAQSIKRRRFKEVLWVDIERRGLLRSGLGARMTLLDVKGIGEVQAIETAAGVVVRLADEADAAT